MYMCLYIFTQFIYIYTLSQRESIYPPNLVYNKKIVHSYFVSINDNTLI